MTRNAPCRRPSPRPLLALLLLAGGLPSTGCRLASRPASYGTPLDTVLTFQSAYAQTDVDGEYRCLSQGLKRSVNRQGYSTLRERLLEPLGTLGRMVLRRNSLEDNLVGRQHLGAAARLWFSVLGNAFAIDLEATPYLTLEAASGARETAIPVPGSFQVLARSGAGARLKISAAYPSAFVATLIEEGIRRAELESQWKLAGVSPAGDETPGLPPPEPAATERRSMAELPFCVHADDLGYRTVELTVEIDAVQSTRLLRSGLPITSGRIEWVAGDG